MGSGSRGGSGALSYVCLINTVLQLAVSSELLAPGYRSSPVVPPLIPDALAADLLRTPLVRLPQPLRTAQ